MRTMIYKTALLLGVIAMLSGCEEVAAPKPVSKLPPDEQPAQLYTNIGADELLERWTVLPNGAVAEAIANPSGRRLAVATDGFSGLSSIFRFSDARKYGACVVFTVEYEFEVKPGKPGEPGKPGPPGQCPDPECEAPGEDIEVDEDEPVVVTGTYHIIDCVGAPDAGNTVEGLFHAAHVCDSKFDRVSIHVLRAGNFNPSTHVHYFGNVGVNAQIADHKDSFEWRKHITIVEGIDPILVNWAILTSDYFDDDGTITIRGGGMAGFDRLYRHQEDLHFSIDGSAGVVDVESNDGDAFKEYRSRCESL